MVKMKAQNVSPLKKRFIERPYLYGSVLVFLIAVILFGAILGVGQLLSNRSGGAPAYKARACPVYPYCRASNQDQDEQFSFGNIVEMDQGVVFIMKKWLQQNNRSMDSFGYGEPREGGRLKLFSDSTPDSVNRKFTDGELQSLIQALDTAQNRGRLYLTLQPNYSGQVDYMDVRLNSKVLDYEGPTSRFAGESEWKLFLADGVFPGQVCPANPCEGAVDIL